MIMQEAATTRGKLDECVHVLLAAGFEDGLPFVVRVGALWWLDSG